MACLDEAQRQVFPQSVQIGAELGSESKQTSCPCAKHSLGYAITGAAYYPTQDHAFNGGIDGTVLLLIERKGGWLCNQMTSCGVKLSLFKEFLKHAFIDRKPYDVAKGRRRELQEMHGMP